MAEAEQTEEETIETITVPETVWHANHDYWYNLGMAVGHENEAKELMKKATSWFEAGKDEQARMYRTASEEAKKRGEEQRKKAIRPD